MGLTGCPGVRCGFWPECGGSRLDLRGSRAGLRGSWAGLRGSWAGLRGSWAGLSRAKLIWSIRKLGRSPGSELQHRSIRS